MAAGIKLKVWGEYASFNRPEMKVERVSYEVMTPSAARGVLEAIYWKPQMRWVVTAIHVLSPIRFSQIRRNEISEKIPVRTIRDAMASGQGNLGIAVEDAKFRQQRAALVLRNVCYGIDARVEVLDSQEQGGEVLAHPEAKHLDTFRRRVAAGQYFHHPYLGCREFPASFELVDQFSRCPDELLGDRDLGFMLHDINFIPDPDGTILESNRGVRLRADAHFFRAALKDGVVRVPPPATGRSER